jgi:hypothetical protein
MTTFAPGIENSGYVGWLTTTIKRRLGSGVFVICGDNPKRGGIFDYLGFPIAIAGDVLALIDELRRPINIDPLGLNLRQFEVLETSPTSSISRDTWFEFHEQQGIVEANYAGGAIARGRLIGERDRESVSTAYAQLRTDGRMETGTAKMKLQRGADGRLVLREDFLWSDGIAGSNLLRSTDLYDDD